jgi:holo-[acyl-carrier protein] synthase
MIGIGSDLLDIRRIEKTISRFGDRFKNKIFTKNEIYKCEKRLNKIECYAKRFAAKEATSKALGTGFRKGVFWKDLEVVNLPSGKPTIKFHGNSLSHLNSLLPPESDPSINLTITDEYPYAQALVIISSEKNK